jgi:hypothetical protein
MSRRVVLLAGALLAAARLLIAQVPPEERIPITDPDRLEAMGFPRDATNVSIWSKADLKGGRLEGREGLRPAEPETWGTSPGYTTVYGCELHPNDPGDFRCDSGNGFFHLKSGQSFPAGGIAQIQVPDGAQLQQISWWLVDESPDEDSNLFLNETCQLAGLGNPTNTLLVQGHTSGAAGNWFSSHTIGYRVNNRDCAYSILIGFGNPSVAADLRFRKATVLWTRQVSPAPATARFSDVPADHPYFRHIEALFESGITSGCQEAGKRLAFCPDRTVTRGEMAVFLAKALGLSWP